MTQDFNQYNLTNLRNQQQATFTQGYSPMMQGNENTNIIQQAGGTYVNRVNASKDADPLTTLGLTAGIGYGIGQAMDHFGPLCEGKYEDTILGKLGAAGDKFSANTKVGRFIENCGQRFNNFMTNWANKSRIGYTLKNHSTRPEWSFAKLPFHGLAGYWSLDATNIIEHDLKPLAAKPTKIFMFFSGPKVNDFNRLVDYGMKKDAIKAFEETLKGKTFDEKALALQEKELELLGFKPSDYKGKTLEEMQTLVKDWKVKVRYGCKDYAELEHKLKHILDDKDGFMKMLENATKNGDVSISINKFDNSLWGRIKSHFIGRKVTLGEYYNKGKVALGKGNKSIIGRALPKAFGWFTEGCTNRFAGGKLAPFMQATIFADMLYHAYNAPKGEHGKTFIERFVNDFMYFVGGTLGVIGIHKFGGFKYLGTDVANRELYRTGLEAHNALRKAGAFASKKEAKTALKNLEKLLGTENLNFFQKILQKAALVVNAGNEHAVAYRSNAKYNLNFLRKIANTNVVGVPLRIWLVMGAITPVLVKAATKGAHAIFGKPTYSVLDEDKEDEETDVPQNNTPQQQTNQTGSTTDINGYPDSNLVKQTINGQYPPSNQQSAVQQYKYNPQTGKFDTVNPGDREYVNPSVQNINTVNTPQNIPNQNSVNTQQYTQSGGTVVNNNIYNTQNSNTTLEPHRTYIPSTTPVQTSGPDTTPADMALANADKAEQEVNSILARKR